MFLQNVMLYFYLALILPETNTSFLVECLIWEFNGSSYVRLLSSIKFEIMNLCIDISTHDTQKEERDFPRSEDPETGRNMGRWAVRSSSLFAVRRSCKTPFTALAREKVSQNTVFIGHLRLQFTAVCQRKTNLVYLSIKPVFWLPLHSM